MTRQSQSLDSSKVLGNSSLSASEAERFARDFRRAQSEVGRHILGCDQALEHALICVMAGGNLLIEGPPGFGKTRLVKTVAGVLNLRFSRIQFTPDLMPADVLGTNVFLKGEDGRRYFEFQAGPIFTQILLADEINRATPKTQSALLEAMQERQITISGETHLLDDPFFVLATRNAHDQFGTYPLPAAQIDRFLASIRLPSADRETLMEITRRNTCNEEVDVVPVLSRDQVLEMTSVVRRVGITEAAEHYSIRLLLSLQPEAPDCPADFRAVLAYGPSPRGLQALILAGKAFALLQGDTAVQVDHLQAVAVPTLRHRVVVRGQAEHAAAEDLIHEAVRRVI